MKRIAVLFAVGLLTSQILRAQGTVYISNLDQTPTGSSAVGSDSWQATDFYTGNNIGGYNLDSIQLEMVNSLGNPNSFTVAIYSASFGTGISPGSSLSILNGSANPSTPGIYSYSPASILTLSPSTDYFIVLTSGTAIANGAYKWSYAGANSYNPVNGWSSEGGGFQTSSDGLHWNLGSTVGPEYAITATAIPEPSVLGFLSLGGLFFGLRRGQIRKCQAGAKG